MKKTSIVIIVLAVCTLLVFLLIKHGSLFGQELTDVGSKLTTPPVTNTTSGGTQNINNQNNKETTKQMTSATINTSMGNIEITFFPKDAPKTVANFTKLASGGFYDGIKFHR